MVSGVTRRETGARREEPLIEHVRIVLVDMSRLTGDMVERAIAHTDDMGVVGRASTVDELRDLALERKADVVILGLHGNELPDPCRDLLLERPRVKVVAIEEREGRARLYELRPEQVEIGEVSPEDVVEMIRATVLRPTVF